MMLKKLVILIMIISVSANLFDISTRIETSSRAIASMIDIMKEKYYIEFNLVLLGDDKNLELIATKIRSRTFEPLTIKIDKKFTNETKFYSLKESKSSIIICSHRNFDLDFNSFNDKSSMSYKRSYFLGYCPYDLEDVNVLRKVIIPDTRFFILGHTADGNMTLIGSEMVSMNSCEPVMRSLNTYLTSEMRWMKTNFIPIHDSFYGCDFEICVLQASMDVSFVYIEKVDFSNQIKYVKGLSTSLLPLLKQRLNIGKFNYIEGLIKQEMNSNGNLVPCDLLLYYHRMIENNNTHNKVFFNTHYAETYPVYHVQYAYLVTKGLSYTPMEKLLLPFDLETWIMIIITFAIGFLTILIIYRCNKTIQRFVFGTYVRDPSLYLTSIFFGIGVTRLPGRNFARFLFMVFTLYCLIIRTAYQGKMFDFLNIDVKRPTASSEEDLIQNQIPIFRVSKSTLQRKLIVNLIFLLKPFSKTNRDDK
jgi:hypothetical protein